jgi:hypothetical protein
VRRTTLLDVHVLVALFDPDHVHHETAPDWFAEQGRDGWLTCPLTEAGFIRVLSNAAHGGTVTRSADLVERLRRFRGSGGHVFWPDEVSLLDASLFDLSRIAGHRQSTDIDLLGLAQTRGGRLATFDRSIPFTAVKGATGATLELIAPVD